MLPKTHIDEYGCWMHIVKKSILGTSIMDDREPRWLPTVGDWIYWSQHKDGNEWDGRGQKISFAGI